MRLNSHRLTDTPPNAPHFPANARQNTLHSFSAHAGVSLAVVAIRIPHTVVRDIRVRPSLLGAIDNRSGRPWQIDA